jgi:ABC-type glycerol-3-phosphate transport system permease component
MTDSQHSTDYRRPKGWGLIFRYAAWVSVAVLFLLPVFWMISSAVKPDYAIFASPPVWWPEDPKWSNFPESLTVLPFGRFAINTLFIAVLNIIGHLLSCTLIAYGFARLKAPGSKYFFLLMLTTLMLPYPITMVPLYIIFSRLGWVNSFLPLIVPAFFGQPFYIFLLRQSFRQIPKDLEDAAAMDGAGTLRILWHIILPMARPALATVAIFTFQYAWNDFLAPLIFLHDQQKYTLMLGLSFFRGSYQVNWAYLMASSLVISVPVILVYFLAQRQFIKGLAISTK